MEVGHPVVAGVVMCGRLCMVGVRTRSKSTLLIRAVASRFCLTDSDIVELCRFHLHNSNITRLADLSRQELSDFCDDLLGFQRVFELWGSTGLCDVLTKEFVAMGKGKKSTENLMVGGEMEVADILGSLASTLNKGVDSRDEGYLRGVGTFAGKLTTEDVIPSRIPQLDAALGIGGIKRGQITTIYGPEGSGKTTMAMYFMAEQQREGKPLVVFDSENSMSPLWMRKIGVDGSPSKMLYSGTSTLEDMGDALNVANKTVTNALFVVDSVPAFLSKSTMEKDSFNENTKVAAEALLWKQILFSLKAELTANNNTLILISQERANMNRATKYDPETLIAGGKVIHYQTSTRIKCKPIKKVRDVDPITKNRVVTDLVVKMEVEKNKQFVQGISLEIPARNNERIDRATSLDAMVTDLAPEQNAIYLRKSRLDEDGQVTTTNMKAKLVVLMDDEVLEAIRADEPDFVPTSDYGLAFDEGQDGPFVEWLDAHPAFMDLAEERYSRSAYWQ